MLLRLLSTRSKRSMRKRRRYGKEVTYWAPQDRLVTRLVKQTGMSKAEICEQLQNEWRQCQQKKLDSLEF